MIYLITGVPGSGKTLYAVAKLLQELLREKIKRDDGSQIERRLCVDGIPQLLLPHEPMAPRREASLISRGKDDEVQGQDGNGLWNWWEWCQPGDVICVDEAQRYWRPRGMGTKVPEDIAKLETHRHYGIDFVIITQNPMLIDQNVRRLVGRHQHVRRIFGLGRALIYDWDGCQTDTSRLGGATRTLWKYPRDAFKLYHSSELHTKQRQKIPLWFAFPVVVVALGIFAGPKAYSTLQRAVTGKGVVGPVPASPPAAGSSAVASAPIGRGPSASGFAVAPDIGPVPSARSLGASVAPKAALLGCISFKGRCECYGHDGYRLEMPYAACEDGARRVAALPLEAGRPSAVPRAPAGRDQDCYAYTAPGQSSAEFGCFTKREAPEVVVLKSSMPSAQGADGATMANGGEGGASAEPGRQGAGGPRPVGGRSRL